MGIFIYSVSTHHFNFSFYYSTPFFVLKGLRSDIGYDIVLTARNAKGKSTETIHHMYTSNGAEKHTGKLKPLVHFS